MSDFELSAEQQALLESGNLDIDALNTDGETQEPAKEEQPEGVVAKDGKSLIPFSELERAREEADRLRAINKERDDEIARLKAEQPQKPVEQPSSIVKMEDQIKRFEELAAQYRDIDEEDSARQYEQSAADLREAMEASKDALAFKQRIQAEQEEREAAVRQRAAEEAQKVIADDPVLSFYRKEHPRLFETVVKYEEKGTALQSTRFWDAEKGEPLPLKVRAAAALEDFFRENPKAPRPQAALTEEEVQRRVDAALKGAKHSEPDGLGDIPGGTKPAESVDDAVDQSSGMALITRLEQLDDAAFQRAVSALY